MERKEATILANSLTETEKENIANEIIGEVAINEDITEEEVQAEVKNIENKLTLKDLSNEKIITSSKNENLIVEAESEKWGEKRYNITNKHNKLQGYIEYTNKTNDSVTIDYVHNVSGQDRAGIGTTLVDKIVSENPNKIIIWDPVNEEKAKNFKQSYIKKCPELANKIMTEGDYKGLVALAKGMGYTNIVEYIAYLEKENEKRNNRRNEQNYTDVFENGFIYSSSTAENKRNKTEFNNFSIGEFNNSEIGKKGTEAQRTNEETLQDLLEDKPAQANKELSEKEKTR